MKFDIDWYVYLKVWKINYVFPSTHAHFNIFHPGKRASPADECLHGEIFIPPTEIWLESSEIPPTGLAACPYKRNDITKRKITISTQISLTGLSRLQGYTQEETNISHKQKTGKTTDTSRIYFNSHEQWFETKAEYER